MSPATPDLNRNKNARGSLQSSGNAGAFARTQRSESDVSLNPLKPPARNKPIDEYLDYAVDEIMTGPLSRGVVRAERREDLQLLVRRSHYRQEDRHFIAGMTASLQTLYSRHTEGFPYLHELIQMSGIKRTNKADRESWRASLQHIPERVVKGHERFGLENATDIQIAEFERGRLAAPIYLSGLGAAYNVDQPKSEIVRPFDPVVLPGSVNVGVEVMSVQTTADPKVFELYDDGTMVTSFTVEDGEDPIAAGTSAYLNMDDPVGEDKNVLTETFDDVRYEVDLNDPAKNLYEVYDEHGDSVASFTYQGDAEDHDSLWAAAKEALQYEGVIELCSECAESLADNEGYDGLCGNCADAAEPDEDEED